MADESDDHEFGAVFAALGSRPGFLAHVGQATRKAIDVQLAGQRTGRFDIYGPHVTKNERSYVGTRIEIEVMEALSLDPGNELDTLIAGKEVDIKTTIGKNWMIPTEAVGKLCLLISSDDRAGTFSVGLIRANAEYLNAGGNKDAKRTIGAEGMKAIRWFGERTNPLPINFLLHLDEERLQRILSLRSGQQRVRELFRICQDMLIPRETIVTLAKQLDPMKRARDARKVLLEEGISVLCWVWKDAREKMKALGYDPVPKESFVSTMKIPSTKETGNGERDKAEGAGS